LTEVGIVGSFAYVPAAMILAHASRHQTCPKSHGYPGVVLLTPRIDLKPNGLTSSLALVC